MLKKGPNKMIHSNAAFKYPSGLENYGKSPNQNASEAKPNCE